MRAAVIGVGHLGRYHAQKYHASPHARLAALVEAERGRWAALREEFKDVPIFSSIDELWGQVDLVSIATPTPSHFEITKLCLEHNLHCLVEKPLTLKTSEAQILTDIAEQRGLVLQVGHVEQFNPALIAAREKLKSPLFIEVHRLAPFKPRSTDVDVVFDLMIHDIDVVLSLVRRPVERIEAVGTPVLTNLVDIANARIEFAGGAVANLTASRVSQKTQRKFRVFQESQYLSIDFGSGEVNLLTKTGEWDQVLPIDVENLPLEAEAWNLEKGDALLNQLENFIEACSQKTTPLVSGAQATKAIAVAESIVQAIENRLKLREPS